MPRHKHYDVIVAWAAGEEIEVKQCFANGHEGPWEPLKGEDAPFFNSWRYEYRVKPKEKDTWKPCASGQLRFAKRLVAVPTKLPNTESLGVVVHKIRTNILQQLMVNQEGEVKWMDVPEEEEDA